MAANTCLVWIEELLMLLYVLFTIQILVIVQVLHRSDDEVVLCLLFALHIPTCHVRSYA